MARAVESSHTVLRQLPAPFFNESRATVWHWWSTRTPHGPWDIVGLYDGDSGTDSSSLLGEPEMFNILLSAARVDLTIPERAGQAAAWSRRTARPPTAHHQRIGSVDEISWNQNLTGDERRLADEVTTRYRSQIAPLWATVAAGAYEATHWTVTQRTLVRHRLRISSRAVVDAPETLETALPTPITR